MTNHNSFDTKKLKVEINNRNPMSPLITRWQHYRFSAVPIEYFKISIRNSPLYRHKHLNNGVAKGKLAYAHNNKLIN